MDSIPPGFETISIESAYISHGGPIYLRECEDGNVFGMRIEKYHTNLRGVAHGAALMLLVDVALGYAVTFSQDPPVSVVTSHLSSDFINPAHLGDWLEARVDVMKIGAKMAYANTFVTKGEKRLVRASAVFTVMEPIEEAYR